MTPINIKVKSWHFWLAKFCDDYGVRRKDDICSYTRAVMIGLFFFAVLSLIALFFLACVADSLAWLAAVLVMWTFIDPSPFASIAIGLGLGVVLVACIKFYRTIYQLRANQQEPGFISVAYTAWKGKWCAPVMLQYGESEDDQKAA